VPPVLRATIRFVAETGEPVHASVVLATIGAIHTRLAVGPDPATPVPWPVAQLGDEASPRAPEPSPTV